ncbi:hypothetical protein BU24DRAFT_428502 [Aaosphaeria arxii CBS 175.79]|uniref:Heavy metal tolerance protein n=1 Tax=Aaosphaeria arxii CBS 175.79 TaxID=1450172 RepID=A0A6A5X9J2_9PLEO|nr:uncharacterized protein BU24DRAFT_428502 [Aaosphaeria arxii CBS 175.79]KAF2009603.1 hypothetical protein BU24DRAFT_428502 [Aaosphaeria arxii CBS 175.79]
MVVLEYAHAPAVGFYFLASLLFGASILQKPQAITMKRRRLAITMMAIILVAHVAEVLYYFSCSIASSTYVTPHDSVVNCLGAILVWTPLSVSLIKAEKIRWHPYFGAFLLDFAFETTICALLGTATGFPAKGKSDSTPLVLRLLKSLAALVLTIDGFVLLLSKQPERGTDEEGQSLLRKPANGAAAANGNAGYGTISDSSSENDEDDEEEEGKDRDKDIKELQAKRLEEEGGWFGYLKGFTIFLPYLWPKNDWILMLCLAVRTLHVIQGRVFNLLTPRQLGIITDKLASGTHVMPWKDIMLWAAFSWVNSYSGFGMLSNFADVVIRNRSYARITLMAYKHVMNLSTDFHTNKESGEVLKAVEQASSLNTIIELVLFEIFPILVDMVVAMWYVTHLFDTYMAFIILFMGGTYVWFGIYFTTWATSRRRKYMEKQRAENQVINETISNWQTVFYFNRSPYEYERFATAIAATISAHYNHYFRTVGGHVLQDLVMTFGFTACCIFAIAQIVAGKKPVGNLVTFIMYWETMMSPLYIMAYSYRTISNSLIDAERLLQLLKTKSTVTDAENATELVVEKGNVEFKDVEFAYDERKQIVNGVSLRAEGGQTIAFVGETGGGKTTMLKLLSRAYDVTNGSICIDGQDIRSVTKSSLIDSIGYVPQDPVLFNRSILDNIRYGRLDATDAEIHDACRAAAVHDAIMSFPDKYNSKVGERGVQLSGGQLQRIAIARVLLRNPKIVLLDEATSAVDSAIEAQIQDAFRKLSAGRTTFVIAHRLSTIVEADQIIVVEQGKVKEHGTHAELLEVGGKYAELWTHQIAGNLSALNSKSGSKATSINGGADGSDGGGKQTDILIDITPAEEDVAKAKAATETATSTATSSGRSDDNNKGLDTTTARKR